MMWLFERLGGGRTTRLAALLAALLAAPALAQTAEDCLACHGDETLTGTRGGREISVHVSAAQFAASVHGGLACIDCHEDLAGTQGHDEEVKPVQCGTCHGDEVKAVAASVHGVRSGGRASEACVNCHGYHTVRPPRESGAVDCARCHAQVAAAQRESLHGRAAARGDELAPTCVTCHGAHTILPRRDARSPVAPMNVPLLCGQCHREGTKVSRFRNIPQQRILENYVDSIHGEGLFKKGLTVTAVCTSCHTAHFILPHTDPRSSISAGKVAATCMQCHGQIEQVHRKVIDGRLWETAPHRIPRCVDCHQPHKARRVFYDTGMANRDCLSCHGKRGVAKVVAGRRVSLFVDPQAYAASTHAGTACAQCHTEVSSSHTRPCETISTPVRVDCSVCHAAQADQYRMSIHGQLAARGDPDAPGCLDCHNPHATKSKRAPTSPTFARNVPVLCARCHRAGEKAAVRIRADVPDIVASYADSIHGKGLTESGLVVTATCVNCHSSHGELPPSDPRSTVNPRNLPATCGACHNGVWEAFRKSIHATGKPGPGQRLPVCEDCHSSHSIQRTDVKGSRTRMMEQCGSCHRQEAETFFETFHGKVSRLGGEAAAKCSDCHGSHQILAPSDPASTLSRANVVATCGRCHAGSHRRFAGYLTHATHHDRHKYPWLFWSFRLMTALLVGTMSFALLHTLAWLVRLWLSRPQWRRVKELRRIETDGQKLYRRFTRFQRTLHLFMLLSFFTLALTGMALKFSYAGWAQGIAWLLGGFETMGVLHRLGAITLLAVFGVHLWDVRRKKRESGRTWKQMLTGPDTILFVPRDARELVQSIRWFFGLGPRPRYGRYSYWEKFDYFAVFWGVMVIGATGLVLWFPELLTRVLPGWSINVATIIHSDEALLAVAFIFTVHFFNTHFRPDKFPMDPVIFTGRMTVEELRHDKPREIEELEADGRLEEHLVDPFPRPVEKLLRVFGFTALGVGILLIALILYAMLFSYQ
jgi:predicted CXXCH cytochrome family protein